MGGGSMVRAVARTAGALGAGACGVREAAPAAARHGMPPRVFSVSASASASASSTFSAASIALPRESGVWRHPYPHFCDGDGLESAGEGESEAEAAAGFAGRFAFGPVPSMEEVLQAVSTIRQISFPLTSPHDAQDQFSSSRQLYGGNSVQSREHEKVIDMFRLLQINPSIQKAVISLSSDETVWDAVMNNEAVKELRESICADENWSPSSDDGDDVPARLLKWIIEITKEKILEFMNKIAKIVNELLFPEKDKVDQMDLLEDALQSSFMLSIMVLIVVLITRFLKV
uniref:Cation/H(+) antiporter 11 n=1 Tax=Anthurium amnicola TaxID=1678845 RepID=A0A1D1XXR2_9ARAE